MNEKKLNEAVRICGRILSDRGLKGCSSTRPDQSATLKQSSPFPALVYMGRSRVTSLQLVEVEIGRIGLENENKTASLSRVEWEGLQSKWGIEDLRESPPLPPGSERIEIWRGEQYKIKAKITGTPTESTYDSLSEREGEPGALIPDYAIKGSSHHGQIDYELSNCVVNRVSVTALESLEADLSTYRARKTLNRESSGVAWLTEWYLNSHRSTLLYPRSVEREFKEEYRKKREFLGEDVAFKGVWRRSSGHCAFVETPDLSFIIQPVPDGLGPSWSKCLGIEYRNNWGSVPNTDVREAVANIISFVMGRPLIGVGFTSFDERGYPIEQAATSPPEDNVVALCQSAAHPPVKLDEDRPSDRFEVLLRQLVPQYLALKDELNLNEVLWGYWLSDHLPLGANLPVLATSLEILNHAWFRSVESRTKGVYLTKKRFDALLEDEFAAIEAKLNSVEYGDRMLRRMRQAYEMGANERLKFFFDEIKLPVGDTEWATIRARNPMAHGSSALFDGTAIQKMVHDTLSYRTLFNRILLKILSYEGTYVDRSASGWPERPLDRPMGGSA